MKTLLIVSILLISYQSKAADKVYCDRDNPKQCFTAAELNQQKEHIQTELEHAQRKQDFSDKVDAIMNSGPKHCSTMHYGDYSDTSCY
jgi:hypothetical protein